MICFLARENGNLFMYSSFMPHDSGVRVSAPQSEFQDFCQAAICPFFIITIIIIINHVQVTLVYM